MAIKLGLERIEDKRIEFPSYSILEYQLDGNIYKVDMSPLLSVSNSGLESASDKEIDEHLERLSTFRFSVATLKERINEELVRAQEQFEKWQSSIWEELYREAIERRKNLKTETKAAASWFGSINKEELRGLMLEIYWETYKNMKEPLSKFQYANNQLGNLLRILEDRGSQLQTILRRRTGLRREI